MNLLGLCGILPQLECLNLLMLIFMLTFGKLIFPLPNIRLQSYVFLLFYEIKISVSVHFFANISVFIFLAMVVMGLRAG